MVTEGTKAKLLHRYGNRVITCGERGGAIWTSLATVGIFLERNVNILAVALSMVEDEGIGLLGSLTKFCESS